MVNSKVTPFFFVIFILISDISIKTKTEAKPTKRQIYQDFASNPTLYNIFNSNNPSDNLLQKFLGNSHRPEHVYTYDNYNFQFPLPEDDEDYDYSYNYIDYGEEDEEDESTGASNNSDEELEVILTGTDKDNFEEPEDNRNVNNTVKEVTEANFEEGINLTQTDPNFDLEIEDIVAYENENHSSESQQKPSEAKYVSSVNNKKNYEDIDNTAIITESTTKKAAYIPIDKLYTSSPKAVSNGSSTKSSSNIIDPYGASGLPNISALPLDSVWLDNKTSGAYEGLPEDIKNEAMLFLSSMLQNITQKNRNYTQSAVNASPDKLFVSSLGKSQEKYFYNSTQPSALPYLSGIPAFNTTGMHRRKPTSQSSKRVPNSRNNFKSNNNQQKPVKSNLKNDPSIPNWSSILLEKLVSYFVQKSLLENTYLDKNSRNLKQVKNTQRQTQRKQFGLF